MAAPLLPMLRMFLPAYPSFKLNAYVAGTTTRQDTYSDSALATPNANPVVAAASGLLGEVRLDPALSYKFVVTTSADVEIFTLDNYTTGGDAALDVLSKTANYTVLVGDGDDVLVLCDATAASFTITLYTAVGNSGKKVRVIKTDTTVNTVTVDPNGSQTINGASTVVLSAQYDQCAVASDGSNWVTLVPRLFPTVLSKSADYTVAVGDGDDVLVAMDATGAARTVTLYTAVGHAGRKIRVKKTDSSTNAVTVDGNGSQTIDGATTQSLANQYDELTLESDGANWHIVGKVTPTLTFPLNIAEGRLTLTSGTPVTTGDVTAATTLYYAPYKGNRIALYDGSATWNVRTFSELSIAVPATTDTMYDVFVYDNAGTATLELTAWTNDTTRATALTTQNGVLVKTGATTRRYVGSFRTTGVSGQTEDSLTKRYVWNYYNRVPRILRRLEGTASWTYTTATIRQANGATANQVDIVVGVAEVVLHLALQAFSRNSTADIPRATGIGLSSTTTFMAQATNIGLSSGAIAANEAVQHLTTLDYYPAVGRSYYSWNEISTATGTCTWVGSDTPTSSSQATQSGLTGSIDG